MTLTVSSHLALIAVASLYARSRDKCSLEGCNVYMDAARKLAPELFNDGQTLDEDYYIVKPTYEPNTLSGVGHPKSRVGDYLPKVIIT